MSTEATKATTKRLTLWQRLKQVGPALVLATVVLGPGSLALSTIAGSVYGYELLVKVVVGLMIVTFAGPAAFYLFNVGFFFAAL